MDRQISLVGKASHRDGHFVATFKSGPMEFSLPITVAEAKEFPDTVAVEVVDKKTGQTRTVHTEYDSIFTLTISRPKKVEAVPMPTPAPPATPVQTTATPATGTPVA